jgi:hypothetical protein
MARQAYEHISFLEQDSRRDRRYRPAKSVLVVCHHQSNLSKLGSSTEALHAQYGTEGYGYEST